MAATMIPAKKSFLQPSLETLAEKLSLCEPIKTRPEEHVYQPLGQPKQCVIDGEIWPPIFKAANVRSSKTLQVKDTDIFVCTYPKCGTTWVQHICSQLLNSQYGGEGEVSELSFTSPMIEKMGAEYCDSLTHPRLLKTHFSFTNTPVSKNGKYIFVARNPKDCLTSYYFHNRNFKIYDWAQGDFDVFFELFVSGQLAFGDYYDHLLGWLPHINDENVLFLKYEDMFDDLETAVYKIGQFLGGNAKNLVENQEILTKIVEDSKIDSMKKNQERYFPAQHLTSDFIRRGGSRDWTNYMSREQSDRMDAIFRTRMAGTEAADWWKLEQAWDMEDVLSMPDIVITSDDDDFDCAEEMCSVSRRVSFLLSPDRVPFMPERRNSIDSIASSGYGSVWSMAIN
ncbi:unnamed protein product [Bursaphelenchus okinawaensis]|uniref:Sulfotransferase domain-containing protein n=1 Tax=Bursaphelenchus okinawaensis TaxID=465554 RepID=A0A811LEM2_9BILA|nr:unnamed protein product [Bursaphelenchus okinawaensis]CAG9121130.1 unnamed protein product [Bursaphelenchus okinawaensis]